MMNHRRILLKISFTLALSQLLLGSVTTPTNSESNIVDEFTTQDAPSKPISYEGMVLIPKSTFVFRNLKRSRKVSVRSFYIDQYEVTVEAFMEFLKSTNYRTSASQEGEDGLFNRVNSMWPKYTVGFVSWRDATAYCRWSGKRLPTPQEWQLAALGTDGRAWPWGVWSANAANIETHKVAQVGSFPRDKSPYGVFDMGGNMFEWSTEGAIGGSYVTPFDWVIRPTGLSKGLDDWVANTGFRCVANVK